MYPKLEVIQSKLPKAENKAVLINNWQNSTDLIKAIASAHKENLVYAKKIAPYFKGSNDLETCKNVFDFLRYEVPYKVETAEAQKVKTLPRMLQDSNTIGNKDAIGNDCKMYAVFTNTILNTLGIPCSYRFVSFKGKQPTHTYAVVKPLNLVIDAVLPTFDTEKPYKYKKDMALYKMSGIDEEEASRKYLDLSSPDSAIGAVNLSKLAAKGANSVKKAVASIPKVTQKVVQTAKTTSLAIPRNAFLGLVALNIKGLATNIMQLVAKGNDLKWWVDLGGDRTKLKNTAETGAKKKALGSIEEDINASETLEVMGFLEPGQIGVEPVSTATALATAVPIIAKLQDVLKKAGISTEEVKKVANLTKQASSKFTEITGKKISEVAFTKDAGKTSKKLSLKPTDLKTPSLETATKVAKGLIKNATGITETQITETLAEEVGGGSQQKPSDKPADKTPEPKDKPKEESIFKNKFVQIGGAVALGVLAIWLTSKKRK
jgi:hypothetical protein